ncbi:MAG: DUF72 domain-containing protein [Candidatus Hermodarchaeota archaeon]
MKEKVLIGTSGWSYDEWVGPFYPQGITKKDFLSYYSQIFYTNEINTTFYNIPSRYIVESWIKKTPKDFLFTVKIPQAITHEKKLDIDKCLIDLENFLKVMNPLIESSKLLAFLIQLPPSFTKDMHFNNLKEFIANWPEEYKQGNYYIAIEFRDRSWMRDEIFTYLKQNCLTYCAVIEPLLPPRMDITNNKFVYIRFHGYGKDIWFDYFFKEEEIKKWAISIKDVINQTQNIGIYFNNHFSGYAAKNSLMMMRELSLKPRNTPDEISILEIKKKSGSFPKGQLGLNKFIK